MNRYTDNTDATLIGKITLPIIIFAHQKPVDQWFRLICVEEQKNGTNPEIHLRLQYQKTPQKKITVADFEPVRVVGQGTFAKVENNEFNFLC